MPFMRKYNTLLVTGTTSIRLPLIKRGVVDFAVGADWSPSAGDVKCFVDGAAVANITNLPTAIASGNGAFWEFILTAAELSCKQLLVVVSDAATKAVEDQSFVVETYGDASAMYVTDFSAQLATPTNVTAATGVVLSGVTHTGAVIPTVTTLTNLPAVTSNWLTAAGIAASALNGKGDWNIGKTGYTVSTVSDKTGYSLSGTQTFNVTGNITGNLSGSVGSLTGHTPQTGDSYARIGATGSGLTSLASAANLSTVAGYLDTEIADIQNRLPAALVGGRMASNAEVVGDKTGYALSSAGVQAVWDYAVEGSMTAVQAMRGMFAALCNKLSGAATTTIVVRDAADTKARITAVVDGSGNRTSVTTDLT